MKKYGLKKNAVIITSAIMVMGSAAPAYAAEEAEAATVTIDFECSEMGQQMLAAMTGVDLSWLNSVVLDINAMEGESVVAEKIATSINGASVGDIMAYVNKEDMNTYIQIPELSDGYLKMDVAKYLEDANVNVDLSVLDTEVASSEVSEEMMAYAEEALGTYIMPFLEVCKETSAQKETTIDGETVMISYSGYTISASDFIEVLANDLETLKGDETLMGIMESSGTVIPKEEWEAAMDEGINTLIQLNEDESVSGMSVNLMGGTSEDGSVTDGYIELDMGDITMKLASFTMKADEEGIDGSINAGIEGVAMASVDFASEEEGFSGALSVNGEEMVGVNAHVGEDGTSIAIAPMIEGMDGFQLVIDAFDDEFGISVNYEDDTLACLYFTVSEDAGEELEIPDLTALENVYDMEDEEAFNAYMETVDVETFMNKLEEAGLGDVLTGSAEEAVEAE